MDERIRAFSDIYTKSIRELVGACPPVTRPKLPKCLSAPSATFTVSDLSGRISCELTSMGGERHRIVYSQRHFDRALPTAISESVESLEAVVFPYAHNPADGPQIQVSQEYTFLTHLAICTKEFNDRYLTDSAFACITGDYEVSFGVTHEGSLLAVDMLCPYEHGGAVNDNLIEFIKMYGNRDQVPDGQAAIQDDAFRDFSILISDISDSHRPEFGFSFTEFQTSISTGTERNVLVLGPYSDRESLAAISAQLRSFSYEPVVLEDSPDLGHQSNFEKLLAAMIISRFVVVLDTLPSGHIAELEALLSIRIRPVVLLRKGDYGATRFLDDRIQVDDLFRIDAMGDGGEPVPPESLRWANQRLGTQEAAFNRINDWRG